MLVNASNLAAASAITVSTTAAIRLGDALIATGEPEPSTVLTLAGVFSFALGIAYWLLKRSDNREAQASQLAKDERDILLQQLEAEREAHRQTMKELTDLLREIGHERHERHDGH